MKKCKCQCSHCKDQNNQLNKIKDCIERVFAHIHSPEFYCDCDCGGPLEQLADTQEKKKEIKQFRYKNVGGYPIVSQVLRNYGLHYQGTMDNIQKFSTSGRKQEFFRQLRRLKNLGLISYKLAKDLDAEGVYYLDLYVTAIGQDWVNKVECA